MKIISTLTNWLVEGVWLPLNTELEVLESEAGIYLKLEGVQLATEAKSTETELPISEV